MKKLNREDLYSLEDYSAVRPSFRKKVMEHKKRRRIEVGPHTTLYFEDRLTMHYQVQEMLFAERIFEKEGIQEELDTYNPLVPDGSNWKATFMIEYADPEERKKALAHLIGIEDCVWVEIDGFPKVWSIADEDLERGTEEKTSSVHFLRFEFTPEIIQALEQNVPVSVGIDHDNYRYEVNPISEEIRHSLVQDLKSPEKKAFSA